MATCDVDTEKLTRAQIEGWSNRLGGAEHLNVRELGNGRAVYLLDQLFGNLRLGIGQLGASGLDDVWCYQGAQASEAWRAALGWDGQGEPEGWYRHPRTGRRRPGGDASRQYVEE